MNKNILLLVMSLFFFNLSICMAPAHASESIQEIQFMTEDSLPLNYIEDEKIKGIFVEVLMEISKQMESRLDWDQITMLPRSKGYQSLSAGGKKCLFGMARTKEREPLFRWAGPVTQNRVVIMAKAGTDIRIHSIGRIRGLKTGVIKDGISEKRLLELDLPTESLFRSFGDDAAFELLQDLDKGMIDLWAEEDLTARWLIKKKSLNPRDFKILYSLEETTDYFAFSKDVSNGFVSAFQRALDRIKKKGVVKQILQRYLSKEIDKF